MLLNFINSLSNCGIATLVIGVAGIALSSTVQAYPGPDNQCPNGWDTNNNTCLSSRSRQTLDASCQATAQFKYCQGSVYVGCKSYGFTYACRLLQLSYSDPQTFQQIMNASRACNLDRNQSACRYLMQYKGYYF